MKNLESYGVVSLDSKEINETQGGFVFLLWLVYKAGDAWVNTPEGVACQQALRDFQ